MTLQRESFPYLTDEKFGALSALATSLGPSLASSIEAMNQGEVLEMLDNHSRQITRLQREAYELGKTKSTVNTPQKPSSVKIKTSLYKGTEGENLLRWKAEINSAILAGRIEEPHIQVAFAMSKLEGQPKDWAFGRLMAQEDCFPDLQTFFSEIEKTYQPPKCEFRLRSKFLKLKQGNKDLRTFSQEARYLVSAVTKDPISPATQVTVFLQGLRDGPIRNQLYREDISSLEQAISLALQEEFSLNEAKRGGLPKPRHDSLDRMDLSRVEIPRTSGYNQARNNSRNNPRVKKDLKCFRCQERGHVSYNCRAPAPVAQPRYGGPASNRRAEMEPLNGLPQ